MATSMNNVYNKLIRALNYTFGYKLTIDSKPFYGKDGEQHSYYTVCNSEYDENKRRWVKNELYGSASKLRIVFYLRDMWYLCNGWELPTDEEIWNNARARLIERGNTFGQHRTQPD